MQVNNQPSPQEEVTFELKDFDMPAMLINPLRTEAGLNLMKAIISACDQKSTLHNEVGMRGRAVQQKIERRIAAAIDPEAINGAGESVQKPIVEMRDRRFVAPDELKLAAPFDKLERELPRTYWNQTPEEKFLTDALTSMRTAGLLELQSFSSSSTAGAHLQPITAIRYTDKGFALAQQEQQPDLLEK